MSESKLENLFIDLYYVKGENYNTIKAELNETIEKVRELYTITKEHDKVKAIKKLKSQYSGLVQRSKEEVGWKKFIDFYTWYKNENEECFY